ncbi:hypothetical protein LINGRAHAP2_LOCUS36106 [Linum grandiflorum]
MNSSLKHSKPHLHHHQSPPLFFLSNPISTQIHFSGRQTPKPTSPLLRIRCSNGEKRSFLSLEEAGLVEVSGLSSHEKFFCRLTISSLNLLKVISEQEGCEIEELNAGKVCDWFLKDKLKREQSLDSAVLRWDDSDFSI